jgi:GNAT superfamily N-acetyltransferase
MTKSMGTLSIARSDDLAAAFALAEAAHLEITEFPEPPLAVWGAFDGERMVRTVSLDDSRGLPIVGRIAVSQAYRGSGLGRRLLTTLEVAARRRRVKELWAAARAGLLRGNGLLGGRCRRGARPAAVGMLHLWPVRQEVSSAGGAQDLRAVVVAPAGKRRAAPALEDRSLDGDP